VSRVYTGYRVRITTIEMGVKQPGSRAESIDRCLKRDHDARICKLIRALNPGETATIHAEWTPLGGLTESDMILARIDVLP